MRIISILLLALASCISPIDVDSELEDNFLVVDGFITDQFGPHEITLSRAAKYGGTVIGGTIFPIFDAKVTIIDANNTITPLFPDDTTRKEFVLFFPGVIYHQVKTPYRTPRNFRAEIGNTYKLQIVTSNGKVYESTPQTVPAGPPIDSIFATYQRLPSSDPVEFESGIEIYSQWQDPVEEPNFYSWVINGIYFIETPFTSFSSALCAFDPDDGCCDKCWINETDVPGNEIAFSDSRFNGELITHQVGFIRDDGLRFGNETVSADKIYHLEVEQHSISKESFQFHRLFQSQKEIDGDIFDPPPASLVGNISNVSEPDEIIIGFFGASSVKKKSIFIQKSMLGDIQRFPRPCGDCRLRSGATLEIPEPFR